MKKILLIGIVMAAHQFSYAQNQVTLNFELERFTDAPEIIEYQSDVRVTIENIDLDSYKIDIVTSTRNYEYTKEESEEDETDATQKSEESFIPLFREDSMNLENEFISVAQSILGDSDYNFESLNWTELTINSQEKKEEFQRDDLSRFEVSKNAFDSQYRYATDLLTMIKGQSDSIPYATIRKYDELLNQITKKALAAKNAESISDQIEKKDFETSFIYRSIEDDEITFTIKITNKKTEESKEYSIMLKVKGAFKIDWSTGAIFNLGQGNRTYFIDENDQIQQGDSENFTPLYPAVLTNFYFRNARKFNIGGSVGFGLAEEQRISFFMGPSIFIGNNQRLVLTGGASLRALSTLKSKFSKNQEIDTEAISVDDLTEDRYRWRTFFGITYNLTSNKE